MSAVIIFFVFWGVYFTYCISRNIRSGLVLSVKKEPILETVIVFIMSVFMSLNYYNSDYLMYESIYNGTYFTSHSSSNILFTGLVAFGNYINLDYESFVCLFLLIGLLLLYRAIKNSTKYVIPVLILYILSSWMLDIVQIRQFFAMAIFLNVLPYLTKEGKKSLAIYCGGVLIAAGFHIIFIGCLFFLIIRINTKKQIKLAVGITVISILLIIMMIRSGMLLSIAGRFMETEQLYAYFDSSSKYHNSLNTVIQYIILQPCFMLGLLVYFCYFNGAKIGDLFQSKYIRSIFAINILLLCLCPLYFYTLQFRRIYRIVLIPSYICLFNLLTKSNRLNRMIQIGMIFLHAFAALYLNLRGNEDLVFNIISYNLLLK